MIELNKTYKDGLGRDVRIICVDAKDSDYPVIGLVTKGDDREFPCSYTKDGKYPYKTSVSDLILPEDFRTFKIDEPVMVRDSDSSAWVRSYFAGVSKDRATCWDKQRTSWTETCRVVWNQCRRPTNEELGK